MAKRTYTVPTTEGPLKIRVTFGVAADFEDETGISVYAGDLSWMRSPKQLMRFLEIAAREAADDPDAVDQIDLRSSLDASSFMDIVNTVTEAITGRKPGSVKAGDAKGGGSGKA